MENLTKENLLNYLIDVVGYQKIDFIGMSKAQLQKEVEDNHSMSDCSCYAL